MIEKESLKNKMKNKMYHISNTDTLLQKLCTFYFGGVK